MLYKMRCKNKDCKIPGGYTYYYDGEWYEYERCPICGHGASFDEFKEYSTEKNSEREVKTDNNTR
uniref:Uncharacterized protein n=1 Tax=viral metagenome TaxID=1070528 RepID=A0A6M3IWI2_9ZZZZ